MAIVVSGITLTSGRDVSTDSAEFREKLPITSTLLEQLALTEDRDNPGGDVWAALSALAEAVMDLEARGVEFDD